jgi:hypothetical protein
MLMVFFYRDECVIDVAHDFRRTRLYRHTEASICLCRQYGYLQFGQLVVIINFDLTSAYCNLK